MTKACIALMLMLAMPALAQEPAKSFGVRGTLPPHSRLLTPDDVQYQFGQLLAFTHGPTGDISAENLEMHGVDPAVATKLAAHVQAGIERITATTEKFTREVCKQRDTIDRETFAQLAEQQEAEAYAIEREVVDGVAPLIGSEQAARLEAVKATMSGGGVHTDNGAIVREPTYPMQQVLTEMCPEKAHDAHGARP